MALQRADSLIVCAETRKPESTGNDTPLGSPVDSMALPQITNSHPAPGHQSHWSWPSLSPCYCMSPGTFFELVAFFAGGVDCLQPETTTTAARKTTVKNNAISLRLRSAICFSPFPFQFACPNPTWSTILTFYTCNTGQTTRWSSPGRSVLYRLGRALSLWTVAHVLFGIVLRSAFGSCPRCRPYEQL